MGAVVGEILLAVVAVGGAACILLVVLALSAGITLIMFRTGSMSPTITAGSVALVQRIPASEISIGDVVTVDRAGLLPVTHRVTDVAVTGHGDERRIRMRGDANREEDPAPYAVTSVRRVLFSVPGAASAVAAMNDPYVLGATTIGATSLVVWAFWPHGPGERRTASRTGGRR